MQRRWAPSYRSAAGLHLDATAVRGGQLTVGGRPEKVGLQALLQQWQLLSNIRQLWSLAQAPELLAPLGL